MWVRVSIVLSWRLADPRIQCTDMWTLGDTHSSSKLRLLRNSKTSRCRFTGIRNCPGCYLTSALSTGDAWFLFCIGMAEKYWHLVAVFQELDKDKTKIIDSNWTVYNEIADRSELSEELANFCPQYPIYQVKMMDDSLTVTRVETEGESRTEKFEMRIPKKQEAKLRSRFPFDFY